MVVTNLLLLYNFTTHLIFCSISFTALQIKKQTWSLSSWSWLDILTQSRKVNRIDPFQFIMLVAGTLRLGIHFNTEGWQNTELSITRLSDLRSHETRKHTHFPLKGSSPFDVLFKHKCNNIPVFTERLEISKQKQESVLIEWKFVWWLWRKRIRENIVLCCAVRLIINHIHIMNTPAGPGVNK